MSSQPVLEPLTSAGLIAKVGEDGRLTVYPNQGITAALDAHIRAHRNELIRALTIAHPPTRPPLDWTEPPWFKQGKQDDDARRARLMAVAKQRLEQSRKRRR